MKILALLLLLSSDSAAFCFQDNIDDFLLCIENEETEEPQEEDFDKTYIIINPDLELNTTINSKS